jgi:beta-galactosidase
MPIGNDTFDERGRVRADYLSVEDQLHKALYGLGVGADFVFAEQPDFAGYDVLLVPPLYVASDALLEKIAAFARAGGHVLLTLKSAFTSGTPCGGRGRPGRSARPPGSPTRSSRASRSRSR